jgi:hypothetical protein
MFVDGSLDGWTGSVGTVPGLDSAAASLELMHGSLVVVQNSMCGACSCIRPDATPADMEVQHMTHAYPAPFGC